MPRATYLSKFLRAGCYECHGSETKWEANNAQALAAQHHDRYGHATWCEVLLAYRYGEEVPAEESGT
jgi:hypothetical protein